MPQKPYANLTTTSFIVSSDESLNRRPLSSCQSTNSSCDNMAAAAAAAAASESIQSSHHHHHRHHHQSYFVTTSAAAAAASAPTAATASAASSSPAHGMAFSQSSEKSSLSSGSYSSSSNQLQPTFYQANHLDAPTATHMTIPDCISSNGVPQQQHHQQSANIGFGSAPNQLSVNSLVSDQYGNFTDTQHPQQVSNFQFADEQQQQQQPNSNGLTRASNGCFPNAGSQGQFSSLNNSSYAFTQSNNTNNNHSPTKSSNPLLVKSSFQQQHSPKSNSNSQQQQRSSLSSLDSAASNSPMPINIKGMILNGVASDEVLRSWLISIKCDEYLRNFLDHGYDMHLLTRMTPQDLTAIGCKSPNVRKKLLLEIKKLNLDDDIPSYRPSDLCQWLSQLKLGEYFNQLCREGYDSVEKVCQLTWEDLEDIGMVKLGHQKRLLLGIERFQRLAKQNDDSYRDHQAIYDVHPNHRMSLHPTMSEKRLSRSTVRSGFFQTKSGNLDNRGVPVSTIMPALKHVSNSLANLDISEQQVITQNGNQKIYSIQNDRLCSSNGQPADQLRGSQQQQPQVNSSQEQQTTMKMCDFSTTTGTMKRPPPLPPVRTNSLKYGPEQMVGNQFDASGIYDTTTSIYGGANLNGNTNGGAPINGGYNTTSSSTSFLRTPKLGTLTATTNKMLSHNGHIQTISTQVPSMKPMPIREAPPPPPSQPPPPPPPPPQPLQSASLPTNNSAGQNSRLDLSIDPLMDSSLIGHQIASADEFPPPPPPQ